MQRALVVLRDPITPESVGSRCASVASEQGEMAVCYLLCDGESSFGEGLSAQRAITAALRRTLGARAESIAVFVASQRQGDQVEDYARAWGATVVIA